MPERVLITGAAGFIGSHLCAYHLNQGDLVIGVDNFSSGIRDRLAPFATHPHFTFYQEDLANWPLLTEIMASVTRVYHLAALVGMFHVLDAPLETLEINIETTRAVLESQRLLERPPVVLITSSSEVYGNQAGRMKESTPIHLDSTTKAHASYCISKMVNESMAMAYYHKYHLPIIITRLFNTIGIGQSSSYGMVVPRFVNQAINDEPLTVFGNGEQTRSFCDVEDTVLLLDLLMRQTHAIGEVVNVGHAQCLSINALAGLIKRLAQSQSPITHTPFEEAYKGGYLKILEREPDTTKLMELTAYKYQWAIEKTLKKIIDATKQGML